MHKAAENAASEPPTEAPSPAAVAQTVARAPEATAPAGPQPPASPLRQALEGALLEAVRANSFDLARAMLGQIEALAAGSTASDAAEQKGAAS